MMKIKYLILLSLFSEMVFGQADSFSWVYHLKDQGTTSLQIIWQDTQVGQAFAQNALFLQAGLEAATSDEFRKLSGDYRIEWEVKSGNGLHRLGVTFASSKAQLALELLHELLLDNNWTSQGMDEWKKQQLYHYQYYRNDPDSFMKWWMNGQEAMYRELENINFTKQKGNGLLSRLGKPCVISGVGKVPESILKDELEKWMHTVPFDLKKTETTAGREHRKREKRTSVNGAALYFQQSPLIAWSAFCLIANNFSNEDFKYSWAGISYVWAISSPDLPNFNEMLMQSKDDAIEQVKQKALVSWLLWLEYNKNEALANAYFELGIWSETMIEDFKQMTPADIRKEAEAVSWRFYEWSGY